MAVQNHVSSADTSRDAAIAYANAAKTNTAKTNANPKEVGAKKEGAKAAPDAAAIHISQQAKQLQNKKIAHQNEEKEKVENIKQQIANGNFQTNPKDIAAAMLKQPDATKGISVQA